mmetsp:Transcript_64490/g.147744  ORF Transcript_64490/g.147744 Transcript_64490/m.147744 type:complete len:816 (-) Transcript_64490:112-2559(-)
MSQFRSEKMELIQLFIQSEAAHGTLHELGEVGAVQFKDLNVEKSAFQRLFVSDVRRCDDMLRILRIFADALVKEKMPARPDKALSPGSVVELHEKLTELEKEIKEHNVSFTALKTQRQELDEHCRVLKQGAKWFQNAYTRGVSFTSPTQEADASGVEMMEGGGGAQKTGMLGHIAGCCATSGIADLARTLFRATRGNMLLKHEEIEDLNTDDHDAVSKSVFVVFFSGDRSRSKIGKICDSFNSNKYKLPESQQQQTELLTQVEERLRDLSLVIDKTHEYRRSKLSVVRDSVAPWTEHVKRELGVFHTLNMFNYDVTHKCLIAEGWCPTEDLNDVREALRRGTAKSGATVQTVLNVVRFRETPPTFFRNSKVAQGTQKIVDAYGMARYQEFNPATFSVITFPFLFGVMFGDIGHGTLMLFGALGLIAVEKQWEGKKLNEIIAPAFYGRYVLLLMSLFSIYCGGVYNECFGIALLPWSYYALDCPEEGGPCGATPIAPPAFGVDPVWSIAENKLGFANSFKMKISIILGVSQMCFGLACKTANCLYFKKWKDLLFENIPEYIFLLSIFGYLCVLIVYKWCTDWVGLGLPAPALLDTLLGMLLEFGSPIPAENVLYQGQATVQTILVIVAVLAVPMMLFPKPLLLRAEHKDGYQPMEMENKDDEEGGSSHGGHSGAEFDFSECMIHQSIHTIEFVLGAVSNTASYLRLWALSLAHAGLSEVFWERVMLNVLEMETHPVLHALAMFAGFAIWASMTFGVLMVMETLSACLHDIRLHWVEFQNKFYGGDGVVFTPLNFAAILAAYVEAESELLSAKKIAD